VNAAVWLLVALGCATEDGPPAPWTEAERAQLLAMSKLPAPPPRVTNRVADVPAAAALGAKVFFDPGFSSNGQVACATCHIPALHFTDGKVVAETLAKGTRNTPSIETSAWQTWYYWDGRADSAWAQATSPLTNPIEHGLDAAGVRARVDAAYRSEFEALFGPLPDAPDAVLAQVGKVLEAYERTLSPGSNRFDRWLSDLTAARPSTALTAQEESGLRVFLRQGDCVACHHGPLLTDHQFHNLGLPGPAIDAGRVVGASKVLHDPFNCEGVYADVSPDSADPCAELAYLDPTFPDWPSAFKTPSLRNVAATAPYMHDGRFGTLDEVVDFYDELPGTPVVGHRELTLQPRELSDAQRADLAAFLGALTAGP
jgi:cytochrome c peroxidase